MKGACSATSELQDDADEAEEDTEEGAGEDLPEGVLAKEHTAAADEAGDDDSIAIATGVIRGIP